MASPRVVTGSMLYNFMKCEHRPWMDLYGDEALRDDASPFVEMLWRHARSHEELELAKLAGTSIDRAHSTAAERERATLEAMDRRERLILGGRIASDDLVGEPDILRLDCDRYVPGDVKSGAADEGPSSGQRKLKVHYAVQLALHVDVLERLGRSAGRRPFVLDVRGDEVVYDLGAPKGPKMPTTLWDDYLDALTSVRAILAGTASSAPALSGDCKECWWFHACMAELERTNDLTLLPEVGRGRRIALFPYVTTIRELAASAPGDFLDEKGKSKIKGVGADTLGAYRDRAVLRASGGSAYLKAPLTPNPCGTELFFDIETFRDRCYLHGFVVRINHDSVTERYVGFFMDRDTTDSEREAFAQSWSFVCSQRPCVVYIYSKYERTWWRGLQQRYPDVCSAEDIEGLFVSDVTTDLYDVVSKQSEWPTMDYSLKTLAKHLGFGWRDTHPSGSASIEWYDRHLRGDASAKQRILDYNEDDCRAMRVLLDGLLDLPVRA